MRWKRYGLPSGTLVVDGPIADKIDAAHNPTGGTNPVLNDVTRSGGSLFAVMREWIPPSTPDGVVLQAPKSADDASVTLIENALGVGPVVVCAINASRDRRVFVLTQSGFDEVCAQGEFRGKTVYNTTPDLTRVREGVGAA